MKAPHWSLAGADDDDVSVRRYSFLKASSWNPGPLHTSNAKVPSGENPNSDGVGGGGVYVALFMKAPP